MVLNRLCKLVAISWRFVTLKREKNASKSPQNLSMFEIAAILLRQIATKLPLDLESPQKLPLKSPQISPVWAFNAAGRISICTGA